MMWLVGMGASFGLVLLAFSVWAIATAAKTGAVDEGGGSIDPPGPGEPGGAP